MQNNNKHITAVKCAFPHTIPIMAGFLFLGMTYGILMTTSGFPVWMTALISTAVFAGSMQFVTVNLLLGAFNPVQALAMTLMINARHLFYGIALLDKYKGLGLKKIYMIFGLTDESFSINCATEVPEGVDKGLFMFYVTFLNQIYWVAGSTIGAVFGNFIFFSTEGIDFVMTAMFTVILLEQWLQKKNRIPVICGLALSVLCLVIFGADDFIIPSMLCILASLSVFKKPIEKGACTK